MKKLLLVLLTAILLIGCNGNTETQNTAQTQNSTEIQNATETQNTTDTSSEVAKTGATHEYFCDKFMLTVDGQQIDLTTIDSDLSSVSELYPISGDYLYILGRVNEDYNSLMIYDFNQKEIIFVAHGTTMCWVQDKFETVRYLKDNAVYDLEGNIIYQPSDSRLIDMIEYVVEDFKVTITDSNYETYEEIWIK